MHASRRLPSPAGETPAEAALRRAAVKLEKGRIADAERLYHDVLRDRPGCAEALHGLGTAALRQGRGDLAIPHLAAALKADPTRPRSWLDLAEALAATGRMFDARALMERFAGHAAPGPDDERARRSFVAKILAHAIRWHEAERLPDAEAACEIVLAVEPRHPGALHLAGIVAYRSGRLDLAADLVRMAIEQSPETGAYHLLLGNVLHAQDRHAEAADAYGAALARDPADAQTRNNLATTLTALGRTDEAIEHYRILLEGDPAYALGWNNLGLAQHEAGLLPEAIASFGRALSLRPGYADAMCHLAISLAKAGDREGALARYLEAIRTDPGHAFAHNNLGNLLRDMGRAADALPHLEEALRQRPDLADIHSNLGTLLMAAGRYGEAAERLRQGIALAPANADLHFNLGNILAEQFRYQDALVEFGYAVQLRPDFIEAYNNAASAYRNLGMLDEAHGTLETLFERSPEYLPAMVNLGNVLRELGRPEEAVDALRKAASLDPDRPETFANLSMALRDSGEFEEAVACYDRMLKLRPQTGLGMDARQALENATSVEANLWSAHSNRLFTRLYMPGATREQIAADARDFGARFCDPLLRRRPFRNDRDPERRLRIGFVSADFRKHSVNFFFEPALRNLDRDAFETFGYSHTIVSDDVTERLRGGFDHFACVRRMDDDALADAVERDGIDILVDLSGHTSGNRLLVFARKPAPVQVSWIGYPGTTGLTSVDYRLADITEPDGVEAFSTEALWRMPDMAICYSGSPTGPVPIGHPPFEDNGHITFGCFNNYSKLSDEVLAAWGEILRRVPGSRLLMEIMNVDKARTRDKVVERLGRLGLPLDRIDFEPRLPKNQYVLYDRIDIALDPFPYNGGTTSMDTLWMGVPFVALEGTHLVSRIGYAILHTVGLPELAARSPEDYVAVASGLANDPDRLRAVRHDLRGRTERSPLMDGPRFGRHLGQAFRGMWRAWVAGKPSSAPAE